MGRDHHGFVVVGIDGSAQGLHAAEFGAREAAMRGLAVLLLRAIPWPFFDAPLSPGLGGRIENEEREQAAAEIEEATARALEIDSKLKIHSRIELASPADLLLRVPAATMIVIGAHKDASAVRPLLGTTATQVATHAACPVIVARGRERATGDVVVGVDGDSSEAAVGFAFEEAALRGTGVTALHAWSHPMALGPADLLAQLDQDRHVVEQRVLDGALAGWSEKYPQIAVTPVISRSHAKAALADASCRAQLIVVGARGRGGFAGLLLGSVGLSLLRSAACPVAVVRPLTA
jgi:nucleotide-binding universal stress UspA family protein